MRGGSVDAKESRIYRLDGDEVEVGKVWDEELEQFINDYPDFETHPRVTPSGRMWVSVIKDDCPYYSGEYGDCGSCEYFKCESPGDFIGICENEKLMIREETKL